jgi:hypothetical protein
LPERGYVMGLLQQVGSTLKRKVLTVLAFFAGSLCFCAQGDPLETPSAQSRVFVAARSGSPLERFFGYDNGRVAIVGSQESRFVVTFTPYAGRHRNAALRWSAEVGNWGEAFSEVAEFVPTNLFLYNAGWYPGGADGMFHPGHFSWDLGRNFASIHVRACTIQTPAGLFDITSQIDPSLGEPYALSVIPPYTYHLHCEADLVDDDSGKPLLRFVHDQQWDPPRTTFNRLFHGKRLRSAIRQTESWWDSRQGELHDSSTTYALDVGCFWQIFWHRNILTAEMLYSSKQ